MQPDLRIHADHPERDMLEFPQQVYAASVEKEKCQRKVNVLKGEIKQAISEAYTQARGRRQSIVDAKMASETAPSVILLQRRLIIAEAKLALAKALYDALVWKGEMLRSYAAYMREMHKIDR